MHWEIKYWKQKEIAIKIKYWKKYLEIHKQLRFSRLRLS